MPVPTDFDDLDTNASNNSPPGTESAKGNVDDYLRAHASFIKQNKEAIDDLPGSLAVHGQCRLTKSGANLLLSRYNGTKLVINGTSQTIPAAGVTLAPTSLAANTTYYIYAYMNSGTMTLEASVTGHATDAATGVEIKSGDATRTLVGMARTIVGPAWEDSNSQRFVISWFNRRGIKGFAGLSTDRTNTSTTFVEVNSEIRVGFLTWSDESVEASTTGGWWNNPGNTQYAAIGVDGVTSRSGNIMMDPSTNEISPLAISTAIDVSEGYHYVTLAGRVTGGTGTFIGTGDGASYIFTTIRG